MEGREKRKRRLGFSVGFLLAAAFWALTEVPLTASVEEDTREVVTDLDFTGFMVPEYGDIIDGAKLNGKLKAKNAGGYYASTSSNGSTVYRKVGSEWVRMEKNQDLYLEGTYRLRAQIRIDGDFGKLYKLADYCEASVEGIAAEKVTMTDNYTCTTTYSCIDIYIEFDVAFKAIPLKFPNASGYNYGSSSETLYVGTAVKEKQLAAAGGTGSYTFAKVSTDPAWLNVSSDGKITGTPPVKDQNSYQVEISCTSGEETKTITISVAPVYPQSADREKVSSFSFTGFTMPKAGESVNAGAMKNALTPAEGAVYYLGNSGISRYDDDLSKWSSASGTAYTEGRYRFSTTIRIEGTNGKFYMLDSTCSVTVEGVEASMLSMGTPQWGNLFGEDYSYVDLDIEFRIHQWDTGYTIDTPATCTSEGSKSIHCLGTGCSEKKDVTAIPKTDHTDVTVEGTPATCTEAGKTDGKKCSVCDLVLKEQETIPALGHDYSLMDHDAGGHWKKCSRCGVADTPLAHTMSTEYSAENADVEKHCHVCSECGYKDDGEAHTPDRDAADYDHDKVCTVCHYVMENRLSHEHETVNMAKAATCKETGMKAYWHCTICGKNYKEETCETLLSAADIEALVIPLSSEHSYGACEKTDSEKHKKTCAVCGKSVSEAHVFDAGTVTKEATEDEEGVRTYACTGCGFEKPEAIARLPHTHEMTYTPEKAATCYATGKKAFYSCSKCGKIYADEEGSAEADPTSEAWIIPKADHDFGDWEKLDGSYHKRRCQFFSCQVSETAAHTPVTDAAVAPTCTEKGKTAGSHCADCGAVITAQEEIPALGHTETAIAAEVPATCTTSGMTAGKKCSVCDTVLEEREEIPALGHTETAIAAEVPATCTESGMTAGKKCSVCDTVLEEREVIPALGHTEVSIPAVAATCTKKGLTEGKKCSVCDTILEEQTETDMIAHAEVTIPAVAATCTKKGLTEGKKCSVCDTILEEQTETDMIAHTEVTIAAVAATCSKKGLTAGKKCSVCDKILEAQKETDMIAHTEVAIPAVAATCTKKGLTEGKKCSVCGEITVAQKETDMTAHTEVTIPAVAATCSKKGLSEGKKCSVCGEITEVQKETPTIAHTEVTIPAVAATCTKKGLTEGKKCSVCGVVTLEQKETDVTAHTPVADAATAPTCTQAGKTEGSHCAVCSAVLKAQEEVPALGHTEVTIAGKPATMKADGLTEGKKCSVCGEVTQEQQVIYKAAEVGLAQTVFAYDGKAKNPKVVIKDSKGNTIAAANYTVKKAKGRKSVGEYTYKITFKGDYSGSKTLKFTVNPKATTISKVTAGSKSLKVTYKKVAKEVTGYEIEVATDKNFTKNVKKAAVKKAGTTSAVLKKLKGSTKYYVRVRTYKTVGKKKFCSEWTTYSKTVKTKK